MRIILLFGFILSSLFANSIEVLHDSIKVSIDGKEYEYSIGKYPLPKDSMQICFVSGKGRVILNSKNNRFLDLNSSLKCYQLPHEKGFTFSGLLNKFNEIYHSEIIDINPSLRSAVGRRNIQLLTQLTGDIAIDKKIFYLVIKSEEFGLPPVHLNVKDKIGNIKFSYENYDSNISVFIVDVKDLKNQDLIEVTNSTGNVVLRRKILLIE